MDYDAGGHNSWCVGSSVEVFSSNDRRWHIGWVVEEDPGGFLRVLLDDQSTERLRRDDAKLAPVGTSINWLPPQSELVSGGRTVPSVIMHQPSGRQCASLEEAWSAHFDTLHRSRAQMSPSLHGSLTARGDPESNGLQVAGAQSGSHLPEERARYGEAPLPASQEGQLEWYKAEVARLTTLLAERDRTERSLRAELKEAREELESRCPGAVSPSLSRSAPSVPRSWQPHRQDTIAEARAEGPGASGSAHFGSGRSGEKPVEIRIAVPRAMTPDELLEEAACREEPRTVPPVRSVRSLAAHAVVRMPSAPHPLTSHGGLAVAVAGSPHSVLIQGSSQAPQPVSTMHSAAHGSGAATRMLTAQSARAPSTVTTGVHKVISFRR
uniref:Uncharacterized protein n=1 Tax=Alexandrium monilatum TaxID=311494 RepID=A0A7S4Q2X0_9DINO|mmetsp:Transcript_76621/g.228343  ORF Transcript_76621/g.228343 Transcript_76621/m.228343 type:complete len:381 (+) Transcript_76621:32-1174(+)